MWILYESQYLIHKCLTTINGTNKADYPLYKNKVSSINDHNINKSKIQTAVLQKHCKTVREAMQSNNISWLLSDIMAVSVKKMFKVNYSKSNK